MPDFRAVGYFRFPAVKTVVFRFSKNSMCAVGMVQRLLSLTAISIPAAQMRPVFTFRPFSGGNRDSGGLPIRISSGRAPTGAAPETAQNRQKCGRRDNRGNRGNLGNRGNPGNRRNPIMHFTGAIGEAKSGVVWRQTT